jgi:hypothetical protein
MRSDLDRVYSITSVRDLHNDLRPSVLLWASRAGKDGRVTKVTSFSSLVYICKGSARTRDSSRVAPHLLAISSTSDSAPMYLMTLGISTRCSYFALSAHVLMDELASLCRSARVRPGWRTMKYFDWAQSPTVSRMASVTLSAVLTIALLKSVVDLSCSVRRLPVFARWLMETRTAWWRA